VSKLSYSALAALILGGCSVTSKNVAAQPVTPDVRAAESSSSLKTHSRNQRRQEFEEETFDRQANAVVERYLAVKKQIRADTGISYSMATSVMSQWGAPGGGYGAVQAEFTPALDWHAFRDLAWVRAPSSSPFSAANTGPERPASAWRARSTSMVRSTTSRSPPTSSRR
jgi:hypothetical protein